MLFNNFSSAILLLRLCRQYKEDGEVRYGYGGRFFVSISHENVMSSSELDDRIQRLKLREVLDSSKFQQFSHLFFDFACSSASHIGSFILPGPVSGEFVQDMHECVEWKIESTINQFGDKQIIKIKVTSSFHFRFLNFDENF